MTDRRLQPANDRVAHVSLRGQVEADRFVSGKPAFVCVPVADLLAHPGGPRDRQVLYGEELLALDCHAGQVFVRAKKDGYCGYVAEGALGPGMAPTHWVSAAATHLYPAADLKSPECASLSLGSRLEIRAEHAKYLETAGGLFVPRPHLQEIGAWEHDPAAVAQRLIGTPYLWGGNSRAGIDCSGLVQAALLACGIDCPGDSDMQETVLGQALPKREAPRRGDLFFWKGHVAMALSDDEMIHANAWQMAVGIEGTDAAIARIEAQGDGPLRVIRRL